MTASVVAPDSTMGGTMVPAVSGSFRPCPVRTQTTVALLSSRPSRTSYRIPATLAADEGSQKIPSRRTMSR